MSALAWFVLVWQVGTQSGEVVRLMPLEECQATVTQASLLVVYAREKHIPATHSAGCYQLLGEQPS